MDVTAARFKKDAPPPCWPVSGLTKLPSSPSHALVQGAQWLIEKS